MRSYALFIVLGITVVLTACTSSQNTTANVTTEPEASPVEIAKNTLSFSDKNRDIEFKYPDNWVVGQFNRDCGEGCERIELHPKKETGQGLDPTLSIMIRKTEPTEQEISSINPSNDIKETAYGGLSGNLRTNNASGVGGSITRLDYIVPADERTYWFIYSTPNQQSDKIPFETVVSTFNNLDYENTD